MQKTSIVVVNWNTCDLTMKCVELVKQYTTIPYEIILVDNGSVDGSPIGGQRGEPPGAPPVKGQ